ncbi:MAG: hypothetical protein JSS61_00215 [Verrucomicrobia bacterium]|nr:hypothetical protein [Verrucomicrobiota bacterium]
MRVGFLALLLLAGCAPSSMEEYRAEGESRCRLLVRDLEGIENRQQLLLSEATLKKHFDALIDLMIEAKKFHLAHPDDTSSEMSAAEEVLQEELRRIYRLEGGREIVERAQSEALIRLDAFERSITRKRESNRL